MFLDVLRVSVQPIFTKFAIDYTGLLFVKPFYSLSNDTFEDCLATQLDQFLDFNFMRKNFGGIKFGGNNFGRIFEMRFSKLNIYRTKI